MKRTAMQALIAVLALLALAATAPAQQQDFSKVQIKTNKISDNFYTLDGQGGTIGVLTGSDGIFMVDSQFAPLTEKIVAAIHAISPAQIKFMVNTHGAAPWSRHAGRPTPKLWTGTNRSELAGLWACNAHRPARFANRS